jgi:hypothetical protein
VTSELRRRRSGLTLVEAAIAASLVGLVALLVGSALLTSSQVSSESYVEGEVVGLATRVLDEATDPLATATAITEADGLHVRVQHTWGLADGSTALGAVLSPGQRFPGWSVELRWVADPVSISEPATKLDWNFDGDATDAATLLGHLELRVFDAPTGGTEQTHLRRPIGAARTRLVAGGAASPASPVLNIFSRVGAPASLVTTSDTALQLNLAVVHDPIPGANGQPERHALRVTRTVALR